MNVHRESSAACPGPLGRREFMQVGALALGGLTLPQVLAARAASGNHSKRTSVIMLYQHGGASQLETYDLKPDAPLDYRSVFNPIPTNVPGIDICEHMPRLARVADRFTLIRSIAHKFADHGGGHKRFLTGRKPKEPTGFVNDAPCVGSMASHALEGRRRTRGLPNYIVLGDGRVNNVDTFSFGASYWPPHASLPHLGGPDQAGF